MAFCKQCGADLNGAKFCPGCGAAADGEMVARQEYASAPVGADVRQRSLADMEHMIRYFSVKHEQYEEFDTVNAEVEERSQRGYGGWIAGAVVSLLIGIFSKGIFFYIAAAAFVALFILLKKKNKDKLAVATARRDALGNELTEYYNDYGYCPVGLEYTKPATLHALNDLIRKGRATNPGDAINLYLDDLHKLEMEKQAEATRRAAEETAANTKKAAKQAKRAANYSSASFWFK